MQSYIQNVINAERNIFGDIGFLPRNVKHFSSTQNLIKWRLSNI